MKEIKRFKDLNIAQRRIGIMIAARLRKENRIREAVKTQDELSKKSGLWSGEEEIKKWRKEH